MNDDSSALKDVLLILMLT